MGGLLGKNRATTTDPFYRPVPPVGPGVTRPNPPGGMEVYDPYGQPGYEYVPTTTIGSYGGPAKPRPNPYGGRYIQGKIL